MLVQDPSDPGKLFLVGTYDWRASVLKFSKAAFNVDWKVEVQSPTPPIPPPPSTS